MMLLIIIVYVFSLLLFSTAANIGSLIILSLLGVFNKGLLISPSAQSVASVISTLVFMIATSLAWAFIGIEMNFLFPVIVGGYNFLMSRSSNLNEGAKIQANGIFWGSVIFLVAPFVL